MECGGVLEDSGDCWVACLDMGWILEGFWKDSRKILWVLWEILGGEIMAEFRGDSGCILVDFGVGSACILGGSGRSLEGFGGEYRGSEDSMCVCVCLCVCVCVLCVLCVLCVCVCVCVW